MEPQAQSIERNPPSQPRSYKRLQCAIASAAIPGLGDWILGDRKRGGLFLALFAMALLCYWPLRLPRFYWPFLLLILAELLLSSVSSCCTFVLGRSDNDAAANWWILGLIPLALVLVSMELNVELHASGFRIFTMSSDSMSPTVNPQGPFLVDTWFFRNRKPQAGEVVVFHHHESMLVKRVVATGGSTIDGINNRIELDGRPLTESYVVHRDLDHSQEEQATFGPFHIPQGEIFVMGDNRDYSLDSRIRSGEYDYGPVFVTDIIGKPLYHFPRPMHPSANDGQPIN